MTMLISFTANKFGGISDPSWGSGAGNVTFGLQDANGVQVTAGSTGPNGWGRLLAPGGSYTITSTPPPGLKYASGLQPAPTAIMLPDGANAQLGQLRLVSGPALGYYGGLITLTSQVLPQVSLALGRTPTLVNIGLDYTKPKLEPNGWVSNANWAINGLLGSGTGLIPVISLPFGSQADGDTTAMLGQIALGAYDSLYTQVFNVFKQCKVGYMRPGWEGNGYWYPWGCISQQSVLNPVDAANYIAAYRRIVGLMRSVLPGWRNVWCPAQVYAAMGLTTQLYPGNAYVNAIGCDVYPGSFWGHSDVPALAAFATAQGKPFALCEAGAASPADVARILAGMGSVKVEYVTPWDSGPWAFAPGSDVAAAWAQFATTVMSS